MKYGNKKIWAGLFAALACCAVPVGAAEETAGLQVSYTLRAEGQADRAIRGLLLVPLRETAEVLGFTVAWEDGAAAVSDETMRTRVTPGEDLYTLTSTRAGIEWNSEPFSLGIAPALSDGTLYVPFALFQTLLIDEGKVLTFDGRTITVALSAAASAAEAETETPAAETAAEAPVAETETPAAETAAEAPVAETETAAETKAEAPAAETAAETPVAETETAAAVPAPKAMTITEADAAVMRASVNVANPFRDFRTLAEAETAVGYTLTLPEVPAEEILYRAIPGELLEVIYKTASEETLRIRKGATARDVSGDYNVYTDIRTVRVGERAVRMRGAGGAVSVATWIVSGRAYAISSASAMTTEEMSALVAAVL